MIGFTGGVLPVFTEGDRDHIAACNCEIGAYRVSQHMMGFYDALPGTSVEDTKHELIKAHFQKDGDDK